MGEIMVPIDTFLQRIKDWSDQEVLGIFEKISFSKTLSSVQLLQIYKYFMPWQMSDYAKELGHAELSARLDDEQPTGTHDLYMLWYEAVVKNFCKEMRAS